MQTIYLLNGFLLFIVAAFFSFYVPGDLLLKALRLKKELARFERAILAWFTGIALFILATYATAYLNLNNLYPIIIYILGFIWIILLLRSKKFKLFSWKIDDIPSLSLMILGTIAFASLMFFSGLPTKDGLPFFGVNSADGIRHVAYVSDQIRNFPPQNPTVAGEPLRGFHYFYDFIISRFALFFSFSVIDLYFKYFPIFISILYGCSFILITNKITTDKTVRRFVIFLAFFSQSATIFLLPFNSSINLVFDAIMQPMGLIINPLTILSIGLLFAGLSILPHIKTSWKYALLFSLIIGVVSEIKVYSGLIAIGSVVSYSLYLLIRYKFKHFINITITLALTAIITALTFFPNNLGAGGLIFTPFEYFKHYMQSGIMADTQWELKRLIFVEHNNWPRLILLYAEAIIIFLLLNFGIRLIFLYKTKQIFSKAFWKTDTNIILFPAIVIPFLIGTFFIQSVSVFDIIQFFWITVVITCIPAGVAMAHLYKKIPSKFKFIYLFFILGITFPSFYVMEKTYFDRSLGVTISTEDTKTLQQVSKIVPENSYLTIIPPSPELLAQNYILPKETPYISALTQRQIYYEKGQLPSDNDKKIQEREEKTTKLQNELIECSTDKAKETLKEIGSPYVITVGKYPCLESTYPVLKKISSQNAAISFYQLDL